MLAGNVEPVKAKAAGKIQVFAKLPFYPVECETFVW